MASDDELWDALEEEQGGEAGWKRDFRRVKNGYPTVRNPLKWLMTNHFELRKLVKFFQKSTKLNCLSMVRNLLGLPLPWRTANSQGFTRRIFGSQSDGSPEGLVLLPSPVGPWRFGEWQAKAEGDIFFLSTFEQQVFFKPGKMRKKQSDFHSFFSVFFFLQWVAQAPTSCLMAMDQKSCGFWWF